MASTINASLTSGLVTSADTSGIIQLQSNGTTIATISSTGLQQNVGAPAFSAYGQGNQSLSNNTWTKVVLAYEEFDTNSNFDTSTYRFTPTVAGYYQINGMIAGNATVTNPTFVQVAIYKNGAVYKRYSSVGNAANYQSGTVSSIVYCNGSTDYIELYGYLSSSSAVVSGESSYVATWLNGAMIRSA